MNSKRLAGKTALVTGSGQGIGAAIARTFAAEGAQVAIVTRTARNGQKTLDAILAAGCQAILRVTDVGSAKEIENVVADVVSTYGKLDIVVHNAASFAAGTVEDLDEDALDQSLNVNLKAAFRLSKATRATGSSPGT